MRMQWTDGRYRCHHLMMQDYRCSAAAACLLRRSAAPDDCEFFLEWRARWQCGISYIIMRLVFVATITQHQYARGRANAPPAPAQARAPCARPGVFAAASAPWECRIHVRRLLLSCRAWQQITNICFTYA